MEAIIRPLVVGVLVIVFTSLIMAFIGLDGTFFVDWVGSIIGDFVTTVIGFVGDVIDAFGSWIWPF